jgi:protein-S-isoprenylcysteine O-methyltransferase Ste14
LIGLLLFTTSKFICPVIAGVIILFAIVLVAWAVISMLNSKLRISPIPAPDAILIISGPYKYIRHPMYTAVLLGTSGLLFIDFSWLRLLFAIVLAIVLIIKLNWEEQMLNEKFIAYKDYRKHSEKIVPYLY